MSAPNDIRPVADYHAHRIDPADLELIDTQPVDITHLIERPSPVNVPLRYDLDGLGPRTP